MSSPSTAEREVVAMEKYEVICDVVIRGLRPLLHHNPAHVDEGGSGGTKGTKVYVPEDEARKAMYLDKEGNTYAPAEHIEGAMVKAAVQHKYAGKKTYKDLFNSRVWVEPKRIKLEGDWEIDARGAKIGTARIVRWRPKWEEWELSFEIHADDPEIQPLVIKEILETAGRIGIGDYRPKFGIFEVVSFDVRG